jgi:hypothetical protein
MRNEKWKMDGDDDDDDDEAAKERYAMGCVCRIIPFLPKR